jgi:hypothetical protein
MEMNLPILYACSLHQTTLVNNDSAQNKKNRRKAPGGLKFFHK